MLGYTGLIFSLKRGSTTEYGGGDRPVCKVQCPDYSMSSPTSDSDPCHGRVEFGFPEFDTANSAG